MQVVAAAVVRQSEGYWLVRRGPGMRDAGMWEFPGGKVEPGESVAQALVRELWEELGLRVRVGALVGTARQAGLELQAYQVEIQEGPVQLREHDAEAVVARERLLDYPMTWLDQQIVRQLP